jgi:hypothetical protein
MESRNDLTIIKNNIPETHNIYRQYLPEPILESFIANLNKDTFIIEYNVDTPLKSETKLGLLRLDTFYYPTIIVKSNRYSYRPSTSTYIYDYDNFVKNTDYAGNVATNIAQILDFFKSIRNKAVRTSPTVQEARNNDFFDAENMKIINK